jgi:hypothetical protein
MKSISEYRKAVVAGIGTGLVLVNSALTEFANWIPAEASVVVTGVLGFATAVSVYLTKNAETIDGLG